MKKTVVVLGLVLALLLGACFPIPGLTPTPGTGPTVDTAGTSDALFKTAVALTLTAQPTSTVVPATPTAVVAVDSPTLPPTDIPLATSTVTLPANLTTTPATATTVPGNPSSTATLAIGQVTAIWTLGIRTYGTLPPLVPFVHLTLVNTTKAEAYISLHADMPDGKNTVIEYPVQGRIKIEAPVAFYHYVVWIGGNKMVGDFRLQQNDDSSIFLYKNKVVIK
ncbi:MAG TPA: hypothetical protein VK249_33635 [Anaerolineales bacterium]|nr:hypothetical protein [Anaerolineales bacterium]